MSFLGDFLLGKKHAVNEITLGPNNGLGVEEYHCGCVVVETHKKCNRARQSI